MRGGEDEDGHQGAPYRSRVGWGGGCPEEAGLRPAPTSERIRREGWLGGRGGIGALGSIVMLGPG